MTDQPVPCSKLQVWLLASRPKTLWAAVAPVLIGIAMAFEAGVGHWGAAVAALFGGVMLQIGANLSNDYLDYLKGKDASDRLGPMRVTQAGLVSPAAMRMATTLVFVLALAAGVYLVTRAGWPIVIIGLLSMLFAILYTAGPYPLGYHGWGDLFALVFFGPVAAGGTFYVQALSITPEVLIAGLAPGFFSLAILTVNNLRDADSDARTGKKTLAVRFGKGFARVEYSVSLLLAIIIVPVVLYAVVRSHAWSFLSALTLIPAIAAIRSIYHDTGRSLNTTLATTGKLDLLFAILFSIGWLL